MLMVGIESSDQAWLDIILWIFGYNREIWILKLLILAHPSIQLKLAGFGRPPFPHLPNSSQIGEEDCSITIPSE